MRHARSRLARRATTAAALSIQQEAPVRPGRALCSLALLVLLVASANPVWGQRRPTRDARPSATTEASQSVRFARNELRRGTPATRVAAELRSRYNEPDERLGVVLMDAGYAPAPVMEALMASGVPLALATPQVARGGPHDATDEELRRMARILAEGGLGPRATEIAGVLAEVYGADPAAVAAALKSLAFNFAMVQIGSALRSVFDLGLSDVVREMKSGGYSCVEAFRAVRTGVPGSGDPLRALYDGSCHTELKTVLNSEYTRTELASMLGNHLATKYRGD